MRADFQTQAQAERAALADLRAQADAPIRLPPVHLITKRVLARQASVESSAVGFHRDAQLACDVGK